MARVVVVDTQLSLAIGKEGQNARLAAKLTNWKIDIKSVAQTKQMDPPTDMQQVQLRPKKKRKKKKKKNPFLAPQAQ